jgi:tRNA(Ile)-lysidine synthase
MEKSFTGKVLRTIVRYRLLEHHDRVMVALSGGPDSVALLFCLSLLREHLCIRLFSIHINHLIRGQEADRDADFAARFSKKLGIPGRILNIDVPRLAREEKLSLEQAGRYARYTLLRKHALQLGATRIATGHNLDDQAETVLMKMLRGTGSKGLQGIYPVLGHFVIRPLLEVTRDEIMAFIRHHGLEFREDTSNLDMSHLRNRIRKHLMPVLVRDYNPHIKDALWAQCQVIKDEDELLEELARRFFKRMARPGRESVALEIREILTLPAALQRRIMRKAIESVKGNLDDVSFSHIERLRESLVGKTGSEVDLPGEVRSVRNYGAFLLFKEYSHDPIKVEETEVQIPGRMELGGLDMAVRAEIAAGLTMDGLQRESEALLDLDRADMPLRIRRRKEGDRFFPLGLGGSKKLKEFFIDEKIEKRKRDSIPLLVDAQDRIMWVMGHRIDDRFKVTSTTQRILHMVMEESRPRAN